MCLPGSFKCSAISVDSGIWQGCPFSPLAFVLAIELLAIKIRDSKDVRGIRHWNVNDVNFDDIIVKIALYAVDITLFLNYETDKHAMCAWYF